MNKAQGSSPRQPQLDLGGHRFTRWVVPALIVALLSACASPSLREDRAPLEPSFAKPPSEQGILWEMADGIMTEYGPEHSGFLLLDGSKLALQARLALIDSAVSSLDIQTYLWYPDNSGRLILERAVAAANRGVHVRLLVDDLITLGQDQVIYELEQRPNIEVRLFNPWEDRSTMSRLGEMLMEKERLNVRMHNKLLIADGNAAVVGGRNIGDHYFGMHSDYNFHDLDLFAFGYAARQSNVMFDSFWNSDWVVSAVDIDLEPDPEFARQQWQQIQKKNRESTELETIGVEPRNWDQLIRDSVDQLSIGTGTLIFDEAIAGAIEQNVANELFGLLDIAQEELLITNAYLIPGEPAIEFLQSLTDRGVQVKILTNSLESHDVPAVNSHYREWRDDLILAGAELYELRADAEIKNVVDVPPVEGEFIGLHTKAFVMDGRYSFVGSMNFDPRSMNINTESGAFIDSPGLAEALTRLMERDMQPVNAWQVLLDENGEPYWVNSDQTVYKQPARNTSQRIQDKLFKVLPKEEF